MRRDVTAETSLMTDLDKHLSEIMEPRNQLYSQEPSLQHGYHRNQEPCPQHGYQTPPAGSNTNSDVSFNASDEDGNINPYATFPVMRQVQPNASHNQVCMG